MPKEIKPFPEDINLIVGKYYNVLCAIFVVDGKTSYIPIIGPPHKDAQFSAPYMHYHMDGRFIKSKNPVTKLDSNGQTNTPIWLEKYDMATHFKGTAIVKKRCFRLTTGLHLYRPGLPYNQWYESMVGKSCAGRKCPHLGTHMLEQNGRLVCPIHNLQGCLKTEKIVERIEFYDEFGRPWVGPQPFDSFEKMIEAPTDERSVATDQQ